MMHDSEFYRGPEHWPQPPDDDRTLDSAGGTTITLKKKLKKNTAKARKKMSESLAGATATVVAAAVLVGALPDVLPVCPTCSRTNCAYNTTTVYNDGTRNYVGTTTYGLKADLTYPVTYDDTDDLTTMSGFSATDRDYVFRFGSVSIQNNRRLVMRIDKSIAKHAMQENEINLMARSHQGQNTLDGSCLYYHFDRVIGYDDGTNVPGDARNFFMIALAYDKNGNPPDYLTEEIETSYPTLNFRTANLQTATRNVPGVAGAQIQVATNKPGLSTQALLDAVTVDILDTNLKHPVGKTMTLTENNVNFRSYIDGTQSSIYQYHEGDGDAHRQTIEFPHKSYNINSYGYIYLAQRSWTDLFQTWMELNDQAPRYGHEVYFPLLSMDSVRCNGITYNFYLSYVPQGEEPEYYLHYYFVPTQEDTVAIVTNGWASVEELQRILQGDADLALSYVYENILPQITLR